MPEAEYPPQEKLPGLTSAAADTLYVQGQSNSISSQSNRTPRQFLLDALFNVFNFDLLGIGLALWLLGRPQDAVISVLILLLNVSFSTMLGLRNWQRMERLLALTTIEASVIRDDQIRSINPDKIVVGDAVVIGPGDQFFADGMLLGDSSLRIDDYLINGSEAFVTVETGDEVFAGSYCVTGHGVYTVNAVGEDRRWAKARPEAQKSKRNPTPLQQLIGKILRILRVLVIMLVTVVLIRFFFAPEIDDDVYNLYIDAISVIFSIAPSGLLFMILVTYASGAAQMGPLGAIVRQPETIEALAQADVLCLGKTGTLTGGEADLESLAVENDDTAVADTRLRQLVGSFARSASTMTPLLQILANSFGGTRFDSVQEAPFLALFGWQALSFDAREMGGTYVLGFERIVLPLLDPEKEIAASEDGRQNTLLFAYTPQMLEIAAFRGQVHTPQDLLPLARIYLSESVRADAVATTQAFLDAGITVKILSSDTVNSVVAAAEQVGLASADSENVATMSGRELERITPTDLFAEVSTTDLYGRLAPHQKQLVVQALRQNDVQVAMVGETVMEVPAMREADTGIAMLSSNQAALNEAEIVLLENSLEVLPAVLELGQGVFNRLLDAMKLSLSHTLVVCWLALVALISGPYYFPYLQSQSLAIVLFTITIPSIVLSFWLVSGKIESDNLAKRLLYFVIPASLTVTALVMIVFLYIDRSASVSYARTVVAHTLVLSGLMLIVFVQPPTAFWAGGDNVSGDYRPLTLVFVLYSVFLVLAQGTVWRTGIFAIGPIRRWQDFVAVWAFTLIWSFVLRGIWRSPRLRRLANFSMEPAGDLITRPPVEVETTIE